MHGHAHRDRAHGCAASAGSRGEQLHVEEVEVEVEPHGRMGDHAGAMAGGQQAAPAAEAGAAVGSVRRLPSSVQVYKASDARVFQVTRAVVTQLWGAQDGGAQLAAFVRSRAEPTSVPFLDWLADQEARAAGDEKRLLAGLCETLVTWRERIDTERMDELYDAAMGALADDAAGAAVARQQRLMGAGASADTDTGGAAAAGGSDAEQQAEVSLRPGDDGEEDEGQASGSGRMTRAAEEDDVDFAAPGTSGGAQLAAVGQRAREAAVAVLSSSPELYAAALGEKLTGHPALVAGYDPLYDAILQAAPPAALTPEGVKRAHADAEELAVDMRSRRKRSVQSLIGRAKLSSEQADALMAGSAASRILDMLLLLPTPAERAALLPDCFTPPAAAVTDGGSSSSDGGAGGEEELWCTPSQMLSEVEARVRAVSGDGPGGAGMLGAAGARVALPVARHQLTGPELLDALQQLKEGIKGSWLEAMAARQQ
ncbi:hypothetical protein FOA52_003347 [Chlamydomonas sp. UWO 241]|nr:hypothetical protein FOA52_003347 [Chlamydomonas sp. UWO 241]